MKKLITLFIFCLTGVFCMDIPEATIITKEQVRQKLDDIYERDVFYSLTVRLSCQELYLDYFHNSENFSKDDAIERLKTSLWGHPELGIKAYIEQEEKRFVELLDQKLDSTSNPSDILKYLKDEFDFRFINSISFQTTGHSFSIGFKLSKEENTLLNKKRSIFWFLISDNNEMQSQHGNPYSLSYSMTETLRRKQ